MLIIKANKAVKINIDVSVNVINKKKNLKEKSTVYKLISNLECTKIFNIN